MNHDHYLGAQGRTGLKTLLREAGFKPNRNQKRAICHVAGPLQLPDGPGSGKTPVLLWRTVNLIVFHGVSPSEVFLSTFTEKAAHQLQEGLRTLLGMAANLTGHNYDLSQMYVGTVHSLCQKILQDRRFAIEGRRQNRPVLMDELAQYFHIHKKPQWDKLMSVVALENGAQEFLRNVFEARSASRHPCALNCLSLFNRLSEECLDPVNALKCCQADPMTVLLKLYSAYLDSLNEEPRLSKTDFALLQQKALAVLDRSPQAGFVFRHVIIDEYQDTNHVQERLFFKLASGCKNICVVGDDDQALYRFRGATVENFVDFPDRCVKFLRKRQGLIPLEINYRSRRRIVDFYGAFMTHCDWRGTGSQGRVNIR
jgi:DNA helicase-2/ATP-dependent DNA helicase PcrA